MQASSGKALPQVMGLELAIFRNSNGRLVLWAADIL